MESSNVCWLILKNVRNKAEELLRVESNFQKLHQRSLDRLEKEMCHRRLYTDAYFRAYKKTSQIREKEAQETFNTGNGTKATSKRIGHFVEKVKNDILNSQETLEHKRRIQELKNEIEYQKIKNRSVSKGRLSKDEEAKLVNRLIDDK